MKAALNLWAWIFCNIIAAQGAMKPPFAGEPDLRLFKLAEVTGLNVADLNSDGRPDIYFLSSATSTIQIFLAQADGKFPAQPSQEIDAGKSASGLALGDFNEDGKLDLAVAHHDQPEVWLLFGNGDGSYRAPEKVRVASAKPHCHAVVAADLNHDGHLDLVFAQSDDNCVWVLLGDGSGKFTPSAGSPFATDRHPYVVALADFNDDGNLDIATPNWFGKSVGILLGDGTGKFTAAPGSPLEGFSDPTALVAGDLNGDGYVDLVVGNNGARGLQVLLGDGKGGFRFGAELEPAAPCYGPVLADLNGDGRLDVVSTATNGARVFSYWLNEGDGKFSAAQSLQFPQGANSICVTDLNRDGLADLCVAPWDFGPLDVWFGRR